MRSEIPTVEVMLEHFRDGERVHIVSRRVELREPTRRVEATDAELIALLDTSDVQPGDVLQLPGLPLGFEVLKGGRDEGGKRRVGLRTRIIVALLLALVGWTSPVMAQQTVITADTVLLEMSRARGQITAAETQATKALALPMSDSARTEAARARGFIRGARTQTLKAEAKLTTLLSVGLPGVPVIRDTVFVPAPGGAVEGLRVLDLQVKPDTVRVPVGGEAQLCAVVKLSDGFVGVSPSTPYCVEQLAKAVLVPPVTSSVVPVVPLPVPVPVAPAPAPSPLPGALPPVGTFTWRPAGGGGSFRPLAAATTGVDICYRIEGAPTDPTVVNSARWYVDSADVGLTTTTKTDSRGFVYWELPSCSIRGLTPGSHIVRTRFYRGGVAVGDVTASFTVAP